MDEIRLRLAQYVYMHSWVELYGYGSIRPFQWTIVLVPVYKHWGRIDLLSDFATVDSDMPHSASCYLTFFRLATQATNYLASG